MPDTSLQFIMTSSLMGVIIFFLPLFANRLFISFLSYFFLFFLFVFFFFSLLALPFPKPSQGDRTRDE